jgi:ribosomal protein S18 acetylase RimI-like enzyme
MGQSRWRSATHERALECLEALDRAQRVGPGVHRDVRRDLVVARARRVQLAADGPDELVSRRSIAMWMSSSSGREREGPAVELLGHAVQPGQQLVAIGVGDDPGRRQHRRVRPRLLDVVGPEAPVEPDRGVELLEDRVLGLGEARHGSASCQRMELQVRRARRDDEAAAGLLYASAAPYYDAFAGSERRARRLLEALWPTPGHTASHAVSHVAVLDGEVVGVLSGFPLADSGALANRFISESLRRMPPWRWPRVARHLHAAGRLTPRPPSDALYVDGLAVAPQARRRGVATALLAEAERLARAAGASGVALDTGVANAAARALYDGAGYAITEVRMAPDAGTVRAIGGPGFVSYFRPV